MKSTHEILVNRRWDRSAEQAWVLSVSSGRGPVEVRRFTAQLASLLRTRCTQSPLRLLNVTTHGPAEAPLSVNFTVEGDLPGRLGDQVGTHLLIARSSARGQRARKRWFAGVRIEAALPYPAQRSVSLKDVQVRSCRAGGPGGQHVNKASTAVQVVHLDTGLRVRCSKERSQYANRQQALRRLEELLANREREARTRALTKRRGRKLAVQRGAPVQTWRLAAKGPGLVPA